MPSATITHRIGHVSDSHFTASGTMHGSVRPADTFTAALEALEATGVPLDLLVHTGDVADEGDAGAYTAAQRAAVPVLDRTGWPVLWVPGNHDVRDAMRRHLLGIAGGAQPIDTVLDVGGLRIVGLDTSIPERVEGRIDPDRLEWLHELLREPAEHGTVVAMHHPPIRVDSTVFERFRLTDRLPFAAAVAGSDVRAVLAGHLHWTTSGLVAGVPVHVAPSTAYTVRMTPPGGGLVDTDGGRAAAVLSLWDDGSTGWSLIPVDRSAVLGRVDEQVFDGMGIDPPR